MSRLCFSILTYQVGPHHTTPHHTAAHHTTRWPFVTHTNTHTRESTHTHAYIYTYAYTHTRNRRQTKQAHTWSARITACLSRLGLRPSGGAGRTDAQIHGSAKATSRAVQTLSLPLGRLVLARTTSLTRLGSHRTGGKSLAIEANRTRSASREASGG